LTGGIGSGKSALAERLVARGAALVDTDAIAHDITRPGGAAIEPLRAAFGSAAISADGALDRGWMRRRAFTNRAAKATLESIVHPLIRTEVERQILAANESSAPYVVIAVPLLVESGIWRERVDRVLVVDCSEATQIARVRERPGLTEAMAHAILEMQAGRDERLAAAQDIVFNEGSLTDLDDHAQRLHHFYCGIRATA
ncbi:MAG: dephospho-CoA kinase, partial [Burkholderiaceae bacterium]